MKNEYYPLRKWFCCYYCLLKTTKNATLYGWCLDTDKRKKTKQNMIINTVNKVSIFVGEWKWLCMHHVHQFTFTANPHTKTPAS